VLVPAITWVAYVTVEYGSPFFPYAETRSGNVGLLHVDELLETTVDGHNILLATLFPAYPTDSATMIKNLTAGISFSVLLTAATAGFLIGTRKSSIGSRSAPGARRILFAFLVGFLVILYVFFPSYSKYSHYGAFLVAPFAAAFLTWLFREHLRGLLLPLAAIGVFSIGIALWAYNNWGHASSDSGFTNVSYLVPSKGSTIERLARSTNRTPETLETELSEYDRALAGLEGGDRILYGDMEPGSLVPSLVGQEFLGDVTYLESTEASAVRSATTESQLRAALRALDIRYVYRPGKSHGALDEGLLLRRVAASEDAGEYLIPTRKLLERRR
jgi:hypothetical protein